MNATREHMGLPPIDPELIYSYVGNGAAVLVRRALGPETSEHVIEEALSYFLKFYRAHALEHTQLYPGIRESVLELAGRGHSLAVLTNKPVRISTDIVQALGLGKHFRKVYGGDSFANKKPDPTGILTLMSEIGVPASDTLMVGDSGVDVQTANNAGVRSCGVAWGFQPEAFAAHTPTLLVRHPREIVDFVEADLLAGNR